MAFKDYEGLDVSREVASEKELRELQKKYGVACEHNITKRGIIACLAITFILTVAIIILYGSVIELSIDVIISMFISYMAFILVGVVGVYNIILKRDIKFNAYATLFALDTLVLATSIMVANMIPITATLQSILPIIGMTAGTLFVILIFMFAKLQTKK